MREKHCWLADKPWLKPTSEQAEDLRQGGSSTTPTWFFTAGEDTKIMKVEDMVEESAVHVRRAAFQERVRWPPFLFLIYFIKDEYVVLPVLFVVNTDSYKMVTIS